MKNAQVQMANRLGSMLDYLLMKLTLHETIFPS